MYKALENPDKLVAAMALTCRERSETLATHAEAAVEAAKVVARLEVGLRALTACTSQLAARFQHCWKEGVANVMDTRIGLNECASRTATSFCRNHRQSI